MVFLRKLVGGNQMSQTRKMKWGILGTHWISGTMAEAIQQSESSELLAIGSRDLTKAVGFAKKYDVPKYYTDYEEMLADPEVEVVYIGLPNHLHKEWIIRCAKAGKHILCEKPFVLNRQEAEEAFAAVKKYNVFCMEALMYRCHPFINHIEEVLASKKIGEIRSISATYTVNIAEVANKTAGGAIRSLGCYPLSLVRLLAKEEPISIRGISQLDHSGMNDNISMALLSFKNGITASIITSDILDWYFQFTVFGSKGVLHIKTNPWLPEKINQYTIKINEKEETHEFKADKPLYTYQIDCVAYNIKKGLNSPASLGVTAEHSLGNITVMDSWLAETKKVNLKLDDIKPLEEKNLNHAFFT